MLSEKIKRAINYFSRGEKALWLCSVALIAAAFLVFDRSNYIAAANSLIGVTSLIFVAKGNPVGQVLAIIFSMLYGYISYTYSYFGEMITYLGMTMPMACISLVSWLKNPYGSGHSQVKVNRLKGREYAFLAVLTAAVTAVFYFILRAFGTANLPLSTFSVTTSFAAVYLTFRRSPYYAIAYSLNDIVLIILWSLATFDDISYLSVVMCFAAFLANDIYGFCSWRKMQQRQSS